ncbi:CURT1A [Scenedesmus sp. PABB004]|nr:CURT1A [Scenedesmus sp. PABB004]
MARARRPRRRVGDSAGGPAGAQPGAALAVQGARAPLHARGSPHALGAAPAPACFGWGELPRGAPDQLLAAYVAAMAAAGSSPGGAAGAAGAPFWAGQLAAARASSGGGEALVDWGALARQASCGAPTSGRVSELARLLPQPRFAHARSPGPAPDTPQSLAASGARRDPQRPPGWPRRGGSSGGGSPAAAAAAASSSYARQREFASYWDGARQGAAASGQAHAHPPPAPPRHSGGGSGGGGTAHHAPATPPCAYAPGRPAGSPSSCGSCVPQPQQQWQEWQHQQPRWAAAAPRLAVPVSHGGAALWPQAGQPWPGVHVAPWLVVAQPAWPAAPLHRTGSMPALPTGWTWRPWQPWQPWPGQPWLGQPWPGQPWPGQPWPGQQQQHATGAHPGAPCVPLQRAFSTPADGGGPPGGPAARGARPGHQPSRLAAMSRGALPRSRSGPDSACGQRGARAGRSSGGGGQQKQQQQRQQRQQQQRQQQGGWRDPLAAPPPPPPPPPPPAAQGSLHRGRSQAWQQPPGWSPQQLRLPQLASQARGPAAAVPAAVAGGAASGAAAGRQPHAPDAFFLAHGGGDAAAGAAQPAKWWQRERRSRTRSGGGRGRGSGRHGSASSGGGSAPAPPPPAAVSLPPIRTVGAGVRHPRLGPRAPRMRVAPAPQSRFSIVIHLTTQLAMAALAASTRACAVRSACARPRLGAALPRPVAPVVRRSQAVVVRAQDTDGSADVDKLVKDLQDKWDKVENKTTVVLYGVGALVALWFSNTLVSGLNSIPLLPKFMELVGLGYTSWFIYRYLLFKSSREELVKDVDELKKKITGEGEAAPSPAAVRSSVTAAASKAASTVRSALADDE